MKSFLQPAYWMYQYSAHPSYTHSSIFLFWGTIRSSSRSSTSGTSIALLMIWLLRYDAIIFMCCTSNCMFFDRNGSREGRRFQPSFVPCDVCSYLHHLQCSKSRKSHQPFLQCRISYLISSRLDPVKWHLFFFVLCFLPLFYLIITRTSWLNAVGCNRIQYRRCLWYENVWKYCKTVYVVSPFLWEGNQ